MRRQAICIILCVLMLCPATAQTFLVHPWQGKRVAYLGDSISDPKHRAADKKYWALLQEWLGITPYVYAVSGRKWNDIPRQAEKLRTEHGDDFDAIIVFIGTNDFNEGIALGEWFRESEAQIAENINNPQTLTKRMRRMPDMNSDTYRGRINIAMDTLKRMFPTKQIVIMTPIHRSVFYSKNGTWQQSDDYCNKNGMYLSEYVEASRETGGVWAVPVIDLNALCGLNPLLDEHKQYFYNAESDLLHPNNKGHERMAQTIMYQLLTLPCVF